MLKVLRYEPGYKSDWDLFVKNNHAPFLFCRDYMEYHQDRFSDCSLMIFEDGAVVALFPANIDDGSLYSHSGLTYGGLVTSSLIKTSKSLQIFSVIFDYARENNIKEINYKCVPNFYRNILNESELYSIFKLGGQLLSRAVSSGINLSYAQFPVKKISGARRALRDGLIFSETLDLELFFKLFNQNLISKYGVSAVHSAAEMAYLKNKFPDNILNYAAYSNSGELCAGVIVYIVGKVAHIQYMLNTDLGKNHRAMDFIFFHLLRFKIVINSVRISSSTLMSVSSITLNLSCLK